MRTPRTVFSAMLRRERNRLSFEVFEQPESWRSKSAWIADSLTFDCELGSVVSAFEPEIMVPKPGSVWIFLRGLNREKDRWIAHCELLSEPVAVKTFERATLLMERFLSAALKAGPSNASLTTERFTDGELKSTVFWTLSETRSV